MINWIKKKNLGSTEGKKSGGQVTWAPVYGAGEKKKKAGDKIPGKEGKKKRCANYPKDAIELSRGGDFSDI